MHDNNCLFFSFLLISNEKILLEYQKGDTQGYRKYMLGTRTIKNPNHKDPSKKIFEKKKKKNRMTAYYRQPIQLGFEEEDFKMRNCPNIFDNQHKTYVL